MNIDHFRILNYSFFSVCPSSGCFSPVCSSRLISSVSATAVSTSAISTTSVSSAQWFVPHFAALKLCPPSALISSRSKHDNGECECGRSGHSVSVCTCWMLWNGQSGTLLRYHTYNNGFFSAIGNNYSLCDSLLVAVRGSLCHRLNHCKGTSFSIKVNIKKRRF